MFSLCVIHGRQPVKAERTLFISCRGWFKFAQLINKGLLGPFAESRQVQINVLIHFVRGICCWWHSKTKSKWIDLCKVFNTRFQLNSCLGFLALTAWQHCSIVPRLLALIKVSLPPSVYCYKCVMLQLFRHFKIRIHWLSLAKPNHQHWWQVSTLQPPLLLFQSAWGCHFSYSRSDELSYPSAV